MKTIDNNQRYQLELTHEARVAACAELGQVTRRSKEQCRAHYEAEVALAKAMAHDAPVVEVAP